MIQIQNITTDMSLDQMVNHVKNIVDLRATIIAQIKTAIAATNLKAKDLFDSKPKKPFKYYNEELDVGWTGYGNKPTLFGDKNPKDFPINDDDAERIANLTGRDVFTVTKKLVKFVDVK
ncbi:hypothetical protein ACO0K0_16225 [Undibacterium sp. SXout11W]|uniref:hypothetical protein n=1 Tax=Undibacterium sp. SXout11W TaxID=3413050 RepID=UPI003BF07BA2